MALTLSGPGVKALARPQHRSGPRCCPLPDIPSVLLAESCLGGSCTCRPRPLRLLFRFKVICSALGPQARCQVLSVSPQHHSAPRELAQAPGAQSWAHALARRQLRLQMSGLRVLARHWKARPPACMSVEAHPWLTPWPMNATFLQILGVLAQPLICGPETKKPPAGW